MKNNNKILIIKTENIGDAAFNSVIQNIKVMIETTRKNVGVDTVKQNDLFSVDVISYSLIFYTSALVTSRIDLFFPQSRDAMPKLLHDKPNVHLMGVMRTNDNQVISKPSFDHIGVKNPLLIMYIGNSGNLLPDSIENKGIKNLLEQKLGASQTINEVIHHDLPKAIILGVESKNTLRNTALIMLGTVAVSSLLFHYDAPTAAAITLSTGLVASFAYCYNNVKEKLEVASR